MKRTSKVATAAKKVVSKGKSLKAQGRGDGSHTQDQGNKHCHSSQPKSEESGEEGKTQCRRSAGGEAWTSRRQRDRPGHWDGREGCQRSDKEVTYKGYTIQAAPHELTEAGLWSLSLFIMRPTERGERS